MMGSEFASFVDSQVKPKRAPTRLDAGIYYMNVQSRRGVAAGRVYGVLVCASVERALLLRVRCLLGFWELKKLWRDFCRA